MSHDHLSKTQQTVRNILQLVREERLLPGQKLPNEYELADRFKIGRGTVREAIRELVSLNVLEVRQGSGTFVSFKNGIPEDPLGLSLADVTDDMVFDMLEVRLMLEPEIAAIAAERATESQIEELYRQCSLIEDLIRNNQPYLKEDARFHEMIGKCSGNSIVQKLMPIITSSVQLNIGFTRDRHRLRTMDEHREIVNAISHHDVRGAKYAMYAHLNTSRSSMLLIGQSHL